MQNPANSAGPRLCIITDDRPRGTNVLAQIVAEAVRGGATMVQYREKSATLARAREELAALAAVCRPAGVPVLVNARIVEMLEGRVPADGIHTQHDNLGRLPELLEQIESANAPLIGYSAHTFDEASAAFDRGADFVTLSPVFDTPSKSGILAPIGLARFAAACRSLAPRPVMGLGGICDSNAARVMEAGACGIAVMRGVFSAPDPCAAARALRRLVDGAVGTEPQLPPGGVI